MKEDDAAETLLARQLVAALLHVAEDDGAAVHAAVNLDEIGDDLGARLPGAAKHEVAHVHGGLLLLRDQIDGDLIGVHVFRHHFADPRRNRRGEQENLDAIRNDARTLRLAATLDRVVHHLLHVFAESHIQHAIGLVQNKPLELAELQRAALQMIQNAPRSSHHELHAATQSEFLGVEGSTTEPRLERREERSTDTRCAERERACGSAHRSAGPTREWGRAPGREEHGYDAEDAD